MIQHQNYKLALRHSHLFKNSVIIKSVIHIISPTFSKPSAGISQQAAKTVHSKIVKVNSQGMLI